MLEDPRIYKYELAITTVTPLLVPGGMEVLEVGSQGDKVCIWALVDIAHTQTEIRNYYVVGTGHKFPPHEKYHCSYVGTAHCPPFVWHVLEVYPNESYKGES